MQDTLGQILADVRKERARQRAKWGDQPHPNRTTLRASSLTAPLYRSALYLAGEGAGPVGRLLGVLVEEMGRRLLRGGTSWDAVLLEEVGEALQEEDPRRIRAELIQVMAVCAAWIEALDCGEAEAEPASSADSEGSDNTGGDV